MTSTTKPEGFTATPVDVAIGSPEWAKLATASKVAAMVGLSPWESPFSLWQRMAGRIPWDMGDDDVKTRGHYLEPGVRQWYREHQRIYQTEKNTRTWVNIDRPWQAASPDGILLRRNLNRDPGGLFEAKTDNKGWEWGEEGTGQIPAHYRVQGIWQMDTLGMPFVEYAVLDGSLSFRKYRLEYDADEAHELREQVRAFMDSVEAGHEPDLDDHSATYQALRQLHPDIEDVTVEVDRAIGIEYVEAVESLQSAQARLTEATSRIAAEVGDGRRALLEPEGIVLATRMSKGKEGTPFLRRSNGLTDKFHLTEKEAS